VALVCRVGALALLTELGANHNGGSATGGDYNGCLERLQPTESEMMRLVR
jgi:hypothetical protein